MRFFEFQIRFRLFLLTLKRQTQHLYYYKPEHLIALLTPRCFQILLMPRMFPIWDFVVGIFARKALLKMGQVLSIHSC